MRLVAEFGYARRYFTSSRATVAFLTLSVLLTACPASDSLTVERTEGPTSRSDVPADLCELVQDVETLNLEGEPNSFPVLRRSGSDGACELREAASGDQAIDIRVSPAPPNFEAFRTEMEGSMPDARKVEFLGMPALEVNARFGNGAEDRAWSIEMLTPGGLVVSVIGWRTLGEQQYVRALADVVVFRLDAI